MARKNGILGTGGGLGTGLLLLVGGLLVKHAEANEVAACSSGFGRFGQALDPNVANSCASAQDLSSAATVAIWTGGIAMVMAACGFVVFLISAGVMVSSKQARTAGTAGLGGARPGTPAGPHSSGTAASQPAVSLDAPSPGGPPTQQPRYGCGHESRPGARFCPVCGRPVADDRRPTHARPEPAPAAMSDGRTGSSSVGTSRGGGGDYLAPDVKPGRHRVSREP